MRAQADNHFDAQCTPANKGNSKLPIDPDIYERVGLADMKRFSYVLDTLPDCSVLGATSMFVWLPGLTARNGLAI
jgi:hypothetical protein